MRKVEKCLFFGFEHSEQPVIWGGIGRPPGHGLKVRCGVKVLGLLPDSTPWPRKQFQLNADFGQIGLQKLCAVFILLGCSDVSKG